MPEIIHTSGDVEENNRQLFELLIFYPTEDSIQPRQRPWQMILYMMWRELLHVPLSLLKSGKEGFFPDIMDLYTEGMDSWPEGSRKAL